MGFPGLTSGILAGKPGRFPPVFPGFISRDLTGETGKFKITAGFSANELLGLPGKPGNVLFRGEKHMAQA